MRSEPRMNKAPKEYWSGKTEFHIERITPQMQAAQNFQYGAVGHWALLQGDRVLTISASRKSLFEILSKLEQQAEQRAAMARSCA